MSPFSNVGTRNLGCLQAKITDSLLLDYGVVVNVSDVTNHSCSRCSWEAQPGVSGIANGFLANALVTVRTVLLQLRRNRSSQSLDEDLSFGGSPLVLDAFAGPTRCEDGEHSVS